MKTKKTLSVLITLAVTFIFINPSDAQNYMSTIDPVKAEALEQAGWKGALLNVAGMNEINGVEVFSQLGKCESGDVILLKFINHNDSDVEIEWVCGVYAKNSQWTGKNKRPVQNQCSPGSGTVKSNQNIEGIKSIIIKANGEANGDCSGNNGELILKLIDYVDAPDNFIRYAPSLFEVTMK